MKGVFTVTHCLWMVHPVVLGVEVSLALQTVAISSWRPWQVEGQRVATI